MSLPAHTISTVRYLYSRICPNYAALFDLRRVCVCVKLKGGGGTDSCALLQITRFLSYGLKASILSRKHRF